MIVHFTKDQGTYRRLATEIVTAKPYLSNISMIGHDMDQAIKNGLISIFSRAEGLFCLQHVSELGSKKLDKLFASASDKKRILSVIYGSQKNGFVQFGLADTIDVSDFNVKLESLKPVWDSIVPGFRSWFVRKRTPIFKNQVVGEALDLLQLDTRFTTNHLEVMHKIQKKNTAEANSGLEVTSVLKTFHQWHLSFEREAERAFYGQGKFRLTPGYEQFCREPTIYLSWSQERKQGHVRKFLQFTPSIPDTYKKSSNAGLKAPPVKKTRRNRGEPE